MIFIVDACHAGNLKGGVQGIEQTASALAASWGKEYKILSCQPNQLSLEGSEWGGGRGLFSYELEDGMKGLADMNNDGVVSMYELQNYIQTNVAKYSEGKQIPMITGDLSKPFVKVVAAVLAALKKEKEEAFPMLGMVAAKGNDDRYVDSLDAVGKKLYASFNENVTEKKLIWPKDTNAMRDYRMFENRYPDNPLVTTMRRNLAASLNNRFDKIVEPLLKGEKSYSTRDECYYAELELDSCMKLLGEQHYMYQNLKARKLYMEAMAYTWAINEKEYNISMRPTLLQCIKFLEESAQLEPNAAYTFEQLGILYSLTYDYKKANDAFQKYLALQPNSVYAKYSLGIIYKELKQYDQAEKQFETLLLKFSGDLDMEERLIEIYLDNNETKKANSLIDQLIKTDSTKSAGYFEKGFVYGKEFNVDSAVYYYELARKYMAGYCSFCDNNIGQAYFVTGRTDSARKYIQRILSHDSTFSFAHFNLGTIDQMDGNLRKAIHEFYLAAKNSPASLEGFISNLQLHFGKTYDTTDRLSYQKLAKESFIFNMQYVSYLSMLLAYIREPGHLDSTKVIDLFFDQQLFTYKSYEDFTWFQNACYKALRKDTTGALESLEKSLKLGFGNYFMLTCDNDLAILRDTPEFKALVQKYFPDKPAKPQK